MNREIIFRKINFIPRPEDYSFCVEISPFCVNLGILIANRLFVFNFVEDIFLRIYPKQN